MIENTGNPKTLQMAKNDKGIQKGCWIYDQNFYVLATNIEMAREKAIPLITA